VGARQHNLKNITVEIPRGRLTAVTGVSGSGKSSLAFDTIYAEGQRRYVESLSVHARQFLEQMQKPDVDRIDGLSPTIAVEQRIGTAGPRSTVATTTEVHDFLRVLFARVGEPRCWECGRPIVRQSTAEIVDTILARPAGERLMLLAPLIVGQRGAHKALLERMQREGFVRARVNGEITMLEELAPLASNKKHTIEIVVDRLVTKPEIARRLADSIETAASLAAGRIIVSTEVANGTWSDTAFSTALTCPDHPDVRLDDLSPPLFSFNSPHGACKQCHGLGVTLEFDRELVVPNPDLSINDGAVAAWRHQGRRLNAIYAGVIRDFCERFRVPPDTPSRNLPPEAARILMEGTTEDDVRMYGASFEGVLPNLLRRWSTTDSDSAKQRLHAFLEESPCPACSGTRLDRRALCVRLNERTITEISHLTILQASDFFDGLALEGERAVIAEPLLRELRQRLRFLRDVGVDYIGLDRPTGTLSGGEFQRLRLATQIGSGLSGVCYVLDEPTIGLHARDTRRLTTLLQRLADMDNTVIVVEHDEEVIAGASYIVDIGPGAGERGGRLVAAGTLDDIIKCRESVTGRFLSGEARATIPTERRPPNWDRAVELHGVTANNLKNITVRIPLGCFVCVTGVSGSGKSTLVSDVLLRALKRRILRGGPRPGPYQRISGASLVDKVVEVDQSAIGRTPRSNPAAYCGVFNLIRDLFAKTREAKIRGYEANRFSFNVPGGRCEHCEGQGTKRIAMHFLPDVYVTCRECNGTRYNRETLEIRYRGKNVAEVLAMPVEEAVRFFDNFANIKRRLQALSDVGLGYMRLGQASNTLSGGEAQRVKLAAELHKSADGHTMYILDEPTTGLHPADVRNLLVVLNRLVERGQTVVVIEHDLDVVAVADWVVDLGPEGGDEGGFVVVEGTPEQIAEHEASHTGRFLKGRLAGVQREPVSPG